VAFDPDEVRVAGSGHVYVAPVGTAFPTSISDPVDTDDWAELGYVTEEGARFSFGRETNDIPAWQSPHPVRVVPTGTPTEVAFDLEQWNTDTIALALGGGTVTEPVAGEFEYEPPAESFIDERALIVEMIDGDVNYRYCFRRAINTGAVEFSFVRADAVTFPITMKVLAAEGDDKPYFVQSDDPALAATGS
jgi:hypothetical protein